MLDDLRHYRAEDDAFQILSPDACVLVLCCVAFIGYVFRGYL